MQFDLPAFFSCELEGVSLILFVCALVGVNLWQEREGERDHIRWKVKVHIALVTCGTNNTRAKEFLQ